MKTILPIRAALRRSAAALFLVAVGLLSTAAAPSEGPIYVYGLEPVSDPGLAQKAQGAPGEGRLRRAFTYEVEETAVRVYRAYDRADREYGEWWTLEPPGNDFHERYAVCPSESEGRNVVTCILNPRVHLAVGPGQTRRCEEGILYDPDDHTLQAYIPVGQPETETRFAPDNKERA
jgi:hypothetical protein